MFELIRRRLAQPVRHAAAQQTGALEGDLSPFLTVADPALKLLSVFDDLKYDRADADMLSPPMRRHVVDKLHRRGFRQVSGNVLENRAEDVRCLIPKSHALGASPFDITRYTPKRAQDFYVLTPTQTACQFIDHYAPEEATSRIAALIAKQPVNLLRLNDYLERTPAHRAFLPSIGHLRYVQREAVESEPLRSRRALR